MLELMGRLEFTCDRAKEKPFLVLCLAGASAEVLTLRRLNGMRAEGGVPISRRTRRSVEYPQAIPAWQKVLRAGCSPSHLHV